MSKNEIVDFYFFTKMDSTRKEYKDNVKSDPNDP